jgi:hypothetical protein
MACQTIARAAGHNAEGGVAVNQRTSHLVDGAIATYCNADVITIIGTLSSNLSSMAGIFCFDDTAIVPALVDALVDELGQLCL